MRCMSHAQQTKHNFRVGSYSQNKFLLFFGVPFWYRPRAEKILSPPKFTGVFLSMVSWHFSAALAGRVARLAAGGVFLSCHIFFWISKKKLREFLLLVGGNFRFSKFSIQFVSDKILAPWLGTEKWADFFFLDFLKKVARLFLGQLASSWQTISAWLAAEK